MLRLPAGVAPLLNAQPREDDLVIEVLYGERFTSTVATEYLARVTTNAGRLLQAAVEESGIEALVRIEEPLVLGPDTVVVPDVQILRSPGAVVGMPPALLILEVRSESSERYALGPKRLAYSRARIPEYCFWDPRAERLTVCRINPEDPDYPWPAAQLAVADIFKPSCLPNVRIPVEDFLTL